MGLLSKLFRKKEETQKVEIEELPMEEKNLINEDNTSNFRVKKDELDREIYEYYDDNADFKQLYDTTRVVINSGPLMVNDKVIYECLISWFRKDWQIEFDERGMDISARSLYTKVYAGINPELIETDPEYREVLMKKLLKQQKVRERIKIGLHDEEDIRREAIRRKNPKLTPCGRYIGGIVNFQDEWKIAFSKEIGEVMHNIDEMQEERYDYIVNETIRKARERDEAERRAEEEKQCGA